MAFLNDETPDSYMVEFDDGSIQPVAKSTITPEMDQGIRNLPISKNRPNTNFVGSALDAIFRPDPPDVVARREAQARADGLMPPEDNRSVGAYLGEINSGLMGALGDEQGSVNALRRAQQAEQQPQAPTDAALKAALSPPVPSPGAANDPSAFVAAPNNYDFGMQAADKFYTDSANRYKNSIKEMYGATAQRDADLANLYDKELVRQKANMDARLEVEDVKNRALADNYSKAEKAVSDFAAIPDVDPNRIFGKGITAKKITSTIGLALGAFGASWSKGPNYAMEMLQSQISNDIEAQKANINKGQANVQNQKYLYDMNRQRFQDDEQAAHVTEAMSWNYAKTEVEKLIAGSNSKITAARGRGLIAEIEMKEAAAKQAAAQRGYVMQAGSGGSDDIALAQLIDKRADAFIPDDKEGKRKVIQDANEDVAKIKLQVQQTRDMEEVLSNVRKLALTAKINPISKDNAALRTANAMIAGMASTYVKGNPSDGETKRQIEPLLVDLAALINAGRVDEIENVLKKMATMGNKPFSGALPRLGFDDQAIRQGMLRAKNPNNYFKKQ